MGEVKNQQQAQSNEPNIEILVQYDEYAMGKIILEEGQTDEVEGMISVEDLEKEKELYSTGSAFLQEGSVIEGTIIAIRGNDIMVDIGFKSEGLLPMEQFGEVKPVVGEKVEVFLDALEDEDGQVVISKKKADFIRVWDTIKEAYENRNAVEGKVKKRIKGGMVVDLMGVDAFLPGSQIALRPVPDFDALIGKTMPFRVIKLNKLRRNIVVSRRIILEEKREDQRNKLLEDIIEGQLRKGVVKNITDFGVFIDLGGLDGLLHITDMSWTRINHPSELLKIGDSIDVKILKYDQEKHRISLGLKQLTPSPWDDVDEKFPKDSKVIGRVVNLTKYGAFVRLSEGVEGLIHVSEMSWTKHINHPSEILEVGREIECAILDVDKENHKISLGLKQLVPDPWKIAMEKYPPSSEVTGIVRNLTAFGAFVEIEEGVEGLIHISDISWTKRVNHPGEFFSRGQKIESVVLEIDPENHKLSLGYKQLEANPWGDLGRKYNQGAETEGKITHMTDRGVIIELPDRVEGFVPITQLGKRVDKPQDAFGIGDILPLKVIEFDSREHRIVLSVDEYFRSREKADLERYLSKHSKKTVIVSEVAKVTRHTMPMDTSHKEIEEDILQPTADNTPKEDVEMDIPQAEANVIPQEQVEDTPQKEDEEKGIGIPQAEANVIPQEQVEDAPQKEDEEKDIPQAEANVIPQEQVEDTPQKEDEEKEKEEDQ